MTQAKIEAVNKLLLAGEPGNISVDEHASYASTGYKPQFIIDAMNEIFWGEWGFSEIGSEVVPGDKGALVVSQVQVWLAGVEFKPTSWGQNRVTSGNVGDAKKGAQTDAIKKALSYFSIGNRAYLGLLKEENQGNQNGNRPRTVRPAANTPRTLPAAQQTPGLSWSAIYQAGARKAMWTRETFYATASGILDGFPVNANNVKALSQEQLQKLQRDVERYQPEQKAS